MLPKKSATPMQTPAMLREDVMTPIRSNVGFSIRIQMMDCAALAISGLLLRPL
jgi:hypothetical protein